VPQWSFFALAKSEMKADEVIFGRNAVKEKIISSSKILFKSHEMLKSF